MPRNGSGTDIPTAGQPVSSGTVIDSTIFNAMVTDVYAEITNSIARDGQSPATANIPMGGFRVTGVADPVGAQDAATKAYADLLASQGVSAAKNRIINGDMRIDQRNSGAAQVFLAQAALAYSVDRWYAYCTSIGVPGDAITGQQIFSTDDYLYRFTGAANITGVGFGQRIEYLNSYDLASTTVTLSATMTITPLTSVAWAAYYANTTNAFGTVATPTRTLISSGAFTVGATDTDVSVSFAVPAGAITGIEILFTIGALTSGTWTVRNVQLESGTAKTAFDKRDVAAELVRCQRHYETGNFSEILPISNGDVIGSFYTSTGFITTKFAVPTITGTSDQGTFNALNIRADNVSLGRSDVVANRFNTGTYVAEIEL